MAIDNECKIVETEAFDWISKNIIEEPFKEIGNPIRRFIPPFFEAYCKILHPFILDLDASDERYSEKEEQRKEDAVIVKKMYDKLNLDDPTLLDLDIQTFVETATQIILKKYDQEPSILQLPYMEIPNGQFKKDLRVLLKEPYKDLFAKFGDLFERVYNGIKLDPHPIRDREFDKVTNKLKVKWADIADKNGLKFHHNISPISFSKKFENIGFPLNLYYPFEFMDNEDCHQLLNILKGFSKTQKILINSYTDNHELVNTLCPIEKMINKNESDALKGGYIIDENQDWVIYSDYHRDLQMTILGGSKKLIATLKEKSNLEIVECDEFSRVDHYSDTLN